jgi:nicotinate dehydrogenase subunit A
MELRINGERRSIEAAPDTPLLLVLRNDLGLLATKAGCALEQCGACTVLVDGVARMSCRLGVGSIEGSEVVTLEGIGTREHPHPLQRAFIAENAAQCGYCTSGMIMSAKALLDRSPDPSAQEIKHALRENLCRCGAYPRVLRAVRRAAGERAGT